MNKFSEYWNYRLPKNAEINVYDYWLENKIENGKNIKNALDLGCGNGDDTKFLIENNYHVASVDFSDFAVKKVSKFNKNNTFFFDMSESKEWKVFPSGFFDIVVASLSLHYFDERTTITIMKQINRILKDGGKLFARVNTINETEAGAGDGEEIEPNFYKNPLRGINKRFFSKEDIYKYFSLVGTVAFKEKEIIYNGKPKPCFEIVCTKQTEQSMEK